LLDKQINKRISNFIISKNINNQNLNKFNNPNPSLITFTSEISSIDDLSLKLSLDKNPNLISKSKNSNFNSGNLLEIKIEESYISLKYSGNTISPVNPNLKTTNNYNLNNITNKDYLKSQDINTSTNINKENILTDREKVNNTYGNIFNDNNLILQNTNQPNNHNVNNSSLTININKNKLVNNENEGSYGNNDNNYNTTGRYLGYLNYFGGKIKENINNITTNLGYNPGMEIKDKKNNIENKELKN